MLRHFDIIVATDENNGIGKNGSIPWRNKEDMDHFRKITIGNEGTNVVIMGRITYESLPKNVRPLPKRKNIVITTQFIEGVTTCSSLFDALSLCNETYKNVYIIGGQRLYEEAITRYGYLCDRILISNIPGTYDCDVFFPRELLICNNSETIVDQKETFKCEIIYMRKQHPENQYLNLLNIIKINGNQRLDRTKVGTKSIFAPRMEFDLRDGFPLLTTKRTWFEGIKKELLFFISGKTDTKILEAQGVNIWKGNTSEEYMQKYNLPWKEGDMGPSYPHQWRHAGAEYTGCDVDYSGKGIDQLKFLINSLRNDSFSRRHIISSWDVANINLMVLPPCHTFVQFFVGCDANGLPAYLDCSLYQRSADMFLGVPFNIASYALLLHIIGHITGLIPRKFIHNLGDAHLYLNHLDQVDEQLQRKPFPFPKLKFLRQIADIDDLKANDIIVDEYKCYPKLEAKMAV
jgi:thymidylate synthase